MVDGRRSSVVPLHHNIHDFRIVHLRSSRCIYGHRSSGAPPRETTLRFVFCLYSFMRSHVVHTQEGTAVVSGLSGAVPAFYIEPWDGSYWGRVNCVINCFVTQTLKPCFTRCEHAFATGRRSSVASSCNALTCFVRANTHARVAWFR